MLEEYKQHAEQELRSLWAKTAAQDTFSCHVMATSDELYETLKVHVEGAGNMLGVGMNWGHA